MMIDIILSNNNNDFSNIVYNLFISLKEIKKLICFCIGILQLTVKGLCIVDIYVAWMDKIKWE